MRKRAQCNWEDYKTDTVTANDLNITSVWLKYTNTEELVVTNKKYPVTDY